MSISVLIADDQPLMRSALVSCLRAAPEITVVGEAATGAKAVELALRHRPDVALVDVRMPVMDGVEATRRMVEDDRLQTRIIVVTSFELDEYIVASLRAGASGFLLKDATAEEIVHAVRVVAAGQAILAPAVTRTLLERFAPLLPAGPARPDLTAQLTSRQRDVLRLVARGMGNAAIAEALRIAESSVKTHVAHLLARFDVRDRLHLVIMAYEAGFVRPAALLADAAPETPATPV
jgi:DNA-binding NarL/FixJ family response regulator